MLMCAPARRLRYTKKRFYGHNVDHIDVDMRLGGTKMWCLKGEC